LLVISAGFNYYLYHNQNKVSETGTATLPLSDYKIMNDPSITPVAMYGVATHSICRCTMFWDKKTGKMYIMIHHLPLSSKSRDYQLWAMVDDRPVSVGIVKDEIRGRFIEMGNVPAGATAFSITLENAGGSAKPTEEETYLRGAI
jgi:anti-sigma-K factor RskA